MRPRRVRPLGTLPLTPAVLGWKFEIYVCVVHETAVGGYDTAAAFQHSSSDFTAVQTRQILARFHVHSADRMESIVLLPPDLFVCG